MVYFPEFADEDVFHQQIARAAWYLAPLSPSVVQMSAPESFRRTIPRGYASELSKLFEGPVPWLSLHDQAIAVEDLMSADIVVCWAGFEPLQQRAKGLLEDLRKQGISVFDVDHTDRVEGSRYIDISHRFPRNDVEIIEQSQQRMRGLVESWGSDNKAFLFCSGPEVQRYPRYDFSDGIKVICNSVINDDELMAAIEPDIQIFGDPIFHFGCSTYAEEFRKKLSSTQQKFGFVNIIPIKYFNLFAHWAPNLIAQTIAVPFDLNIDINLDLSETFKIHTTDNILTLMMLPVASTFAKEVYLLGCDGRPLEQNNYFWKHNDKTQFGSQMDNIQQVHPTFFTVDYDEYYLRHCQNVEAYFAVGEEQGKRFVALTPSYIPAIRSREHLMSRVDQPNLSLALEPELTANDLAAVVSAQTRSDTEYKILGPFQSSIPGTTPYFSTNANRLAELQWLQKQIDVVQQPIELTHFGEDQVVQSFVQGPAQAPSSILDSNEHSPWPTEVPKLEDASHRSMQVHEEALLDLAYEQAKDRLENRKLRRAIETMRDVADQTNQELDRRTRSLAAEFEDVHTQSSQELRRAIETMRDVADQTNQELDRRTRSLAAEFEDVHTQSSQERAAILKRTDSLSKEFDDIRQSNIRVEGEVAAQSGLVLNLDSALRETEARLGATKKDVQNLSVTSRTTADHIQKLEQQNTALRMAVQKLDASYKQLLGHHNEVLADFGRIETAHARMQARLEAFLEGDRVREDAWASKALEDLRGQFDQTTKQIWQSVDVTKTELSELKNITDAAHGGSGPLEPAEWSSIGQLDRRLGVALEPQLLDQLTRALVQTENKYFGSLGFPIADALAQAICVMSGSRNRLNFAQVGPNYGLFAVFVGEVLQHCFKSLSLVFHGPFEYEKTQNQSNQINAIPPSLGLLKQNLFSSSIDRRKMKGLTAKTQQAQVADLDLLLVPADVEANMYESALVAGGFLVLTNPSETLKVAEKYEVVWRTQSTVICRKL